jgi:acetoacetate decarboxylase
MIRKAMSWLIALLACAGTGFAAETKEIPPPPWLMTNTHGIEVGYALDEATVRKLLPKGIEPVKEMTGGFEMYTSPGGFGITPYSALNFFVDVEGIDMPDGRKGRWMLLGFYGPSEEVAAAIRDHYAWPVRAGSSRVERKGDDLVWTGIANGKDAIEVRIRRKSNDCEWHSALDLWSGKSANGPVLINPIPNTYCYREVELSGIDVRAASGDPLTALQPGGKPIAYAVEWENGAWSFTKPVTKR